MCALGDRQPEPARGQNTGKLTMGKQRYVSRECAQAKDQTVGAIRDRTGHFTARTAIDERVPSRVADAYVAR